MEVEELSKLEQANCKLRLMVRKHDITDQTNQNEHEELFPLEDLGKAKSHQSYISQILKAKKISSPKSGSKAIVADQTSSMFLLCQLDLERC